MLTGDCSSKGVMFCIRRCRSFVNLECVVRISPQHHVIKWKSLIHIPYLGPYQINHIRGISNTKRLLCDNIKVIFTHISFVIRKKIIFYINICISINNFL